MYSDEKLDEVLSIFVNARSRLDLLETQCKFGNSDAGDLVVSFLRQALHVAQLAGYIKYKRDKEARELEEFKRLHD